MGSLAYIALVLALAVGIYLLIRYQRERQKELYRMEALRDSRLYRTFTRSSCAPPRAIWIRCASSATASPSPWSARPARWACLSCASAGTGR